MRYDRIMWGILLLFVGGVLLLSNFNIIDFYWGRIFKFWPVVFITIGLTMIFNRNGSQLGSKISLGVLVLCLVLFFFSGQEGIRSERVLNKNEVEEDGNFKEPFTLKKIFTPADSGKLITLNIEDGGGKYELKSSTDSLLEVSTKRFHNNEGFLALIWGGIDSTALTLKVKEEQKKHWNFKDGNNEVDLRLNPKPVWKLNLNMGVSKVDFDLSDYKIRAINFNGGAAQFEVKIGDLLPITDVEVNSGVAEISIEVPETSGCQITTDVGLSTKDFDGFTKVSDKVYQTPNFKSTTKKVFINLSGGLSTFEVKRY